jgi:hypothetical protein
MSWGLMKKTSLPAFQSAIFIFDRGVSKHEVDRKLSNQGTGFVTRHSPVPMTGAILPVARQF